MAGPRLRFRRLLALSVLSSSSWVVAQTPTAPSSPPREPAAPREEPALDATATLDRARIYYESAQYADCVEAFTQLLERPERLVPRERAGARTYLAACQIALGKPEEARQQFRQAILEDRQLEPPDPVVFPQSVVETFLQVRSTLMDALQRQQEEELQRSRKEAEAQRRRDEQERLRVLELERLAAFETVVRKNERWMAWVPYGMGQFHNDNDTLGWIFLSTELALTATAITATSIELGLHSQAEGGRAALDSGDLSDKVSAARQVGTAAWLSLVGVAAIGIVEANLSYRAELPAGLRRRLLPDALRRGPRSGSRIQIAPELGKGWLGVRGSF